MRLAATWRSGARAMRVPPPAAAVRAPAPRTLMGDAKTNIVAQYVGPFRKVYARLKLFSLSSLSVAAVFAPIFVFLPHKMEIAARLGIALTTLGASGLSTGLISWIGGPYVGHMHFISDGIAVAALDATPSDPGMHAGDQYYLELATLSWNMRSLKTTVYVPSLLRATTRPLATWELPALPPPLVLEDSATQAEQTVSRLVAETVDMSRGKVVGRWWARWRITPRSDGSSAEFQGTCDAEGSPVRYFYVDESLLGEDWKFLE
ncbi:hypothetical protein MSPP1_003753 [Malassezia sp. CBS 17886]|nr:hypothetical protein MSPP1_003753 [Malassezia sp. CBS 17886]